MVTINNLPVFDALITDEGTGMYKISLVDDPAVMSNFLAFDANHVPVMYSVENEEKRLCFGVVMRANFPIYRISREKGEFYIVYKPDVIRTMAEKYLAESRQNDVNVMHQTDVDGVQMVQYFIKDSAKGISPAGFDDIADGSLFAEFHIVNDDVWQAVKAGTYRGFSLEGVFAMEIEEEGNGVPGFSDKLDSALRRILKHSSQNMSKLSRFKEKLAKIFAEFGNITTDKGVLAWDGEDDIKIGDAVFFEDEEGNRTPAEDGEYTSDTNVYVVTDGKVEDIRDVEHSADPVPVDPAPADPVEMTTIATDNGDLIYEGELAEGTSVFVAGEDGNVPAPDGEYVTEDGKTITVADGKVASIKEAEKPADPAPADEEKEALRRENATLKAKVATLEAEVEKMQKMPLAKPAHDEIATAHKFSKTGNRGIDTLASYLSAE